MQSLVLGLSLIDLALVAGVAIVLPLGLGGSWWWWAAAASAIGVACTFERGSVMAVLLSLPWVAVGLEVTISAVREAGPLLFWTRHRAMHVLACAYGLFAAAWCLLSRYGATPLGIREPIVQLTAVHFVYAGVGALILAGAVLDDARTRCTLRVATWAAVLVAGAPPIVAIGFAADAALPQVGGAVLMSVGVFCTAALQLHAVVRGRCRPEVRVLLAVSGLAVWAPMVLAVAWAAGQHWDVPVLSIPDMVRTHGAANAAGFVLCGLLARRSRPVGSAAWS